MASEAGTTTRARRWTAGVAVMAALTLGGVSWAQEPTPRGAAPLEDPASQGTPGGGQLGRSQAVIVVTVDGLRWQEVFLGTDAAAAQAAGLGGEQILDAEGLMPNFYQRFVRGGAVLGAPDVGEPVLSAPAAMSLPGYMELLSGRHEERCASNKCPATKTPTLLDQARRRAGAVPGDVAAISSWEVIERAATSDPTGFPMSFGRAHGLTRDKIGVDAPTRALMKSTLRRDPFPGYEDYRPDAITSALALRYLKVKQPTLLYVGLGDIDEYAHRNDYAGYQSAIRQADAFLGQLFAVLDQMGERGAATTVFVTTDHGRGSQAFAHHGAAYPDSRRVWLGAAGGAVAARGLVAAPVTRRLADVAPTVRLLLGLKPDASDQAGAALTELLSTAREP